jgi:hypothetical protein
MILDTTLKNYIMIDNSVLQDSFKFTDLNVIYKVLTKEKNKDSSGHKSKNVYLYSSFHFKEYYIISNTEFKSYTKSNYYLGSTTVKIYHNNSPNDIFAQMEFHPDESVLEKSYTIFITNDKNKFYCSSIDVNYILKRKALLEKVKNNYLSQYAKEIEDWIKWVIKY